MKNAYEVLRQKEAELSRIRHEIASLRIVAPLLSDQSHSDPQPQSDNSEEEEHDAQPEAEATGTDALFSFTSASRPKIWNVLKRRK